MSEAVHFVVTGEGWHDSFEDVSSLADCGEPARVNGRAGQHPSIRGRYISIGRWKENCSWGSTMSKQSKLYCTGSKNSQQHCRRTLVCGSGSKKRQEHKMTYTSSLEMCFGIKETLKKMGGAGQNFKATNFD